MIYHEEISNQKTRTKAKIGASDNSSWRFALLYFIQPQTNSLAIEGKSQKLKKM